MSFLAELQAAKLRTVRSEDVQDRSSANLSLSKSDVIENEDEVWKYFFESGCDHWFSGIQEYTFRSSFIDLHQNEAEAIVDHWLQKQRMVAAAASYEKADVDALTEAAMFSLEALCSRLDAIVAEECKASAAGKAFVKLSTRSPKDSKKALARAEKAYLSRIQDMSSEERCDDNLRWKILSEEVTRAGAVTSGSEALELLLDSEPPTTGRRTSKRRCRSSTETVSRYWDPDHPATPLQPATPLLGIGSGPPSPSRRSSRTQLMRGSSALSQEHRAAEDNASGLGPRVEGAPLRPVTQAQLCAAETAMRATLAQPVPWARYPNSIV